jgi:hypothetical protein
VFTFSKLGTLGDFGNQLFEVAATIGIARKHEQEFVFPQWRHACYFRDQVPQTAMELQPDLVLAQYAFHYTDIRITTDPACLIDLRGFFQSEKFFLHVEDVVRQYFMPHPTIVDQVMQLYGPQLSHENSCIIVVRRGDYAQFAHEHPLVPASFYSQAMSLLPSDTTYIVTSDDIEWCRANIHAERITYTPQQEWRLNFFAGTLCRNAITSNTSFGWWIAWLLGRDKRVFAPRQWFGPGLAKHSTGDLFPPEWITL